MNYLIKIVEFFMNFASGKSQEISAQVIETVRKLVILVITSLGAMTVFCVALTLAFKDLMQQLDGPMGFTGSWTFAGGLLLSAIALIVFLYSLSEKNWKSASEVKAETKENNSRALEEAIALLITTFIQERQASQKEVSSL